jgi:hypothetical protein
MQGRLISGNCGYAIALTDGLFAPVVLAPLAVLGISPNKHNGDCGCNNHMFCYFSGFTHLISFMASPKVHLLRYAQSSSLRRSPRLRLTPQISQALQLELFAVPFSHKLFKRIID